MKIGMMNSPARPLRDEIKYAAENRFDYIDLTMEPPKALKINVPSIRALLQDVNLGIVGHTAYYLQLDSPFPKIRAAVQEELISQLQVFSQLGAEKVTIHFMFSYPHRFFSAKEKKKFWVSTLNPLLKICENLNIQLMLENTQNSEDTIRLMIELLTQFPDLGFNLDVAHANLNSYGVKKGLLLEKLANRLSHVHVSDNFGGDDLHLPLGAGFIPWRQTIKQLKRTGYDKTITLEVFSSNRFYLLKSRDFLRKWWRDS